MRVEFDPKDFDIDLSQENLAGFGKHFSPIAQKFQMNWRLAQSAERQRRSFLFQVRSLPCRFALSSSEWRTGLRHSADYFQSCG